MKKNMKKIIAVLLVLMFCVSILSACGGGLSGKYVLTQITNEEGKLVSLEDYVKAEKAMYEEYDMLDEFDESVYEGSYVEFLKDDKYKMVKFGDASEEGTFKVDGKTVELTVDDETVKGTIDGKKITFDYGEDYKVVFEKK